MPVPDVLVIGGGIFGLWCARACRAAGLGVVLVERAYPGAGASGGPVGALTPFAPSLARWDALKSFQLEALAALPGEIAALEAEARRPAGYARVGRLTPLGSSGARAAAEAQVAAAERLWQGLGRLQILERTDAGPAGLLAPEACRHGLLRDSLSARIDPAACCAALVAALTRTGVKIRTGGRVRRIGEGGAVLDDGPVAAGAVVVSAGWESMALLGLDAAGAGVKGQAAVLDADLPVDLPVLQGRGLYVCAHAPGRVGVGSTSERTWSDPEPDGLLDDVIGRARALCPSLARARVVERWAGLRPRAPRPMPMVGALPGRPGVIAMTGGYKIGFGLAHALGRAVARQLSGAPGPDLPAEFAPEAHGIAPPGASDGSLAGP